MTYQLKYYKEIKATGHMWRLEVYQDTESVVTPKEIGPVLQGLKLVVQGDQADIDTPIVKTSLEMAFVEAEDIDENLKCGYWEEFYTSSATEYKVILYKDGVKEWSGYITPDSFAEDLCYHGSVSIIARDNLGTMQDTTFDMSLEQNPDRKVYVWELIEKALRISTCVLDYDVWNCNAPEIVGLDDINSNYLLHQMVDIEAFDDMDWWEALEKTLYSVGLVIRYVGKNTLALLSLRDIPKYGQQYWWDVPVKNVAFVSYGRRELVPGIKDIRETFEFDIDVASDVLETVDRYVENQKSSVQCDYMYFIHNETISVKTPFNVPTHGYKKPRINQYMMPEYSNLLDVSVYNKVEGEDSEEFGQWDDKSIIYFAVNSLVDRPIIYSRNIYSTSGKLSVKFTLSKPVSLTIDNTGILNTPIKRAPEYGSNRYLTYCLKFTDLSTSAVKGYDAVGKKWVDNVVQSNVAVSADLFTADKPNPQTIELTDIPSPGVGKIELEFVSLRILPVLTLDVRRDCYGMYMRIKDIVINVDVPEDVNIIDKITLTTHYSDKYSVRLNRTPELAINPTSSADVAYVTKAILTKGNSQYYGAEQWVWRRGRAILPATGISLSRLIHQQLLAYHAIPNNVLSGELIDKDGNMPDFTTIWHWNGKPHYMISGSLNILNGHMENATLREFKRYDHIWETWVENEDIKIDYPLRSIVFVVHSNEQLTLESYAGDFGGWITMREPRYNEASNVWEVTAVIYPNLTGYERMAIIKIDTADVRIIQRSAGDYNDDYSEDYS